MPFAIPTLKDIGNRTVGAFRANLKGSDALLWPNNLFAAAKAIAGAVFEAFSFLDYISKQILVHTATDGIWIERHAREYGLSRLPASYAEGKIVLHGDPSVAVPSGRVVERGDGVRYEITSAGTTDLAGAVTLSVRALEPGRLGNAVAGVQVGLTEPLSQIQGVGEVAADGIGGGADIESFESLRQRVWHRKRLPPHGGARHDYVAWAREINGVTRVFVDPVTSLNGRSTVGVWFLMDDLYPNGIPQQADIDRVVAYFDVVKPAGAIVQTAAPQPVTVNITIQGLSPDTTAVRDAIKLELAGMFLRECRVSTLDEPFTLYKSLIEEAISIATGEHHHTLSSPTADIAFALGQLPVLGTVSFIP